MIKYVLGSENFYPRLYAFAVRNGSVFVSVLANSLNSSYLSVK